MKIVMPHEQPRERLGGDLRSGSVHEIWREPSHSYEPTWSLSLVDVKRNVRSLERPEGTIDHWLGISGPQLRLVADGRDERVRADHQIVIESASPTVLLRSSTGRAKSTRLLRVTRHSETLPILMNRVFVSDPVHLDSDVRALYLVSGALSIDGTAVDVGAAAIFDEPIPPMRSEGAIIVTIAIPDAAS